jgi:hypothetical protein
MKFDSKGNFTETGLISKMANYLASIPEKSIWDYMVLKVEIDPIVDYLEQNIFIRWADIKEGFNDKVIINCIEEFISLFSLTLND